MQILFTVEVYFDANINRIADLRVGPFNTQDEADEYGSEKINGDFYFVTTPVILPEETIEFSLSPDQDSTEVES